MKEFEKYINNKSVISLVFGKYMIWGRPISETNDSLCVEIDSIISHERTGDIPSSGYIYIMKSQIVIWWLPADVEM